MSVEILARLEADLPSNSGNPDLLLCDYFDFVCGTAPARHHEACIAGPA